MSRTGHPGRRDIRESRISPERTALEKDSSAPPIIMTGKEEPEGASLGGETYRA